MDVHLDEPNSSVPTSGRRVDTSLGAVEQNAWPRGLAEAVQAGLPYSVAVLDRSGAIVAVNAAWKHFARENGAPALAESSVGLNYLAVCRAASGESSEGAQKAAAGIQAVLEGSQSLFTLEYACHSPTEQRWFVLHVAPLPGGQGSAIVSHLAITERKQLEQALAEQKRVGGRLGEILVARGKVSRPLLDRLLARQSGVALEVERGFGSGLRSVIERRHLERAGLPTQLIADDSAATTIGRERRLLQRRGGAERRRHNNADS